MPMGHVSGNIESAFGYCGGYAIKTKIKGLKFIQLEQDLEKKTEKEQIDRE